MSRARPVEIPEELQDQYGERIWFQMDFKNRAASHSDLELLASVEDVEIDDLLDEGLTQDDVRDRLLKSLGQGGVPAAVQVRRNAARVERQQQPQCRLCAREGDSTRHHFVNRWIMRELSTYAQIGARSRCTVPVCMDCHRDLHDRGLPARSIVEGLTADERSFARDVIEQLRRERPRLFELLREGDGESRYEARLIQDWAAGRFDH